MPAVQTPAAAIQTPCTYPLVGVEALLADIRRLSAELDATLRFWRDAFSWSARQRANLQEIELAAKVAAYSIVTGQPESAVTALIAA